VLFFWGKFSQPGKEKKKKGAKGTKGVFQKRKKEPKSSHYMRKKKNLNSSYLDNSFQQVVKLHEES
jgi:hypothetical protein